jgi:Ribosomal L32p protein family
MPHRVCPKCGHYKGPEVVQVGKGVVDAMGSDRVPHAKIDGALAATSDLEIGVISRRADRCRRAGVAP